MTKATLLLMLGLALVAGPGQANDDLLGTTVYRGVDGKLTSASKTNLELLLEEAKLSGPIALWVTFDVDFIANPALRTAETNARLIADVESAFNESVGQLLTSGHAEVLPTPSGLELAPGRMISVTKNGLNKLVEHRKVKHISYVLN